MLTCPLWIRTNRATNIVEFILKFSGGAVVWPQSIMSLSAGCNTRTFPMYGADKQIANRGELQ